MKRTMHISLSILGALKEPENWVNCITVNGRLLVTTEEVKSFLLLCHDKGYRLLPMSDCEGFDYVTGCPGHFCE